MTEEKHDAQRKNYLASQLSDVNTTEPNTLQLAIRNPDFSPGTKWLNITQAEFKQIERILTLGTQGETDS